MSPFMKLCWSSLTPLKHTQISCNSLLLIITTSAPFLFLIHVYNTGHALYIARGWRSAHARDDQHRGGGTLAG